MSVANELTINRRWTESTGSHSSIDIHWFACVGGPDNWLGLERCQDSHIEY